MVAGMKEPSGSDSGVLVRMGWTMVWKVTISWESRLTFHVLNGTGQLLQDELRTLSCESRTGPTLTVQLRPNP